MNKMTRRDFLLKTAKAGGALAAASGASELLSGSPRCPGNVPYDIVIKGGLIHDGTPAPPIEGDIGIAGDKIAAIGRLSGTAPKIIDASGLIVTPGFIDVHNHADQALQRLSLRKDGSEIDPAFQGNHCYLYQGVTTVVAGNCGWGIAETDSWLKWVNSVRFGTNSYQLAPHGVTRQKLFGEKQPEELTEAQLDLFKGAIADSMAQGAVGMSTGLAYSPGFLTRTKELIELAKVVRRHGGLYATHIRDEAGRPSGPGQFGVLESIKEAIEIGRQAEIPVQISHLKISQPLNGVSAGMILELIEAARAEGLDVTADQYPYESGSSFLSILLPIEFVEKEGVKEKYKSRPGRGEVQKAIEQVFGYLPPEKILIAVFGGRSELEGKTLREISALTGKSPGECFADLVCGDEVAMGVFFSQDPEIIRQITPRDYVMTASDGWPVPKGLSRPHPRSYGTFPRKIRKFALEEKALSLRAALRSMTSLPAEKFRLRGRGKIAPGNFADIAVIDLKTIRDKATYLDPHQYAEGVRHLLVNGVVALENGRAREERGGKGLRREAG
jgi:N-acyl-D-aspartate/D-glutamate deacylase